MARVVKAHEVRRRELLETAQALFYEKGYENTSVADIIDTVGIAKGTFYHYFKSKEALLDEIVRWQTRIIDEVVTPIIKDPRMTAVEKFNTTWANIGQYKLANRGKTIAE